MKTPLIKKMQFYQLLTLGVFVTQQRRPYVKDSKPRSKMGITKTLTNAIT